MLECLQCAEENLKSKTNELSEVKEINETLQEKIAQMELELASYQDNNNDHSMFICF